VANQTAESVTRLLDVGIELGYLTRPQADAVLARQAHLRRGGVMLSLTQVLVERKYVVGSQLKLLMNEVEFRRKHAILATPEPAQRPPPPRKFGQYEVLEVLAEKSRARVIKARDTTMDRIVVLKVLPPAAAADKQWFERFRREMQLSGKLSHPNIVSTFGAGEIDGCPLMIMEYADGLSLNERLDREGNVPEKIAWLIAREIAKGLGFAASQGIMHRDIKPANIMCSNDGRIRIADMGFSKSMNDDSSLTAAGTTVGTPFYISPEQAEGSIDIDTRTDIYSLGCTVFHMLTGSVPILGESMMEVMMNHSKAPRPDPRSILPEISEASANLVKKMMAVKPRDRHGSAVELIIEIDALLPLLPEPVAEIRPLNRFSGSEGAVHALKSSAGLTSVSTSKLNRVPENPALPPLPPQSIFVRAMAWLKRLIG